MGTVETDTRLQDHHYDDKYLLEQRSGSCSFIQQAKMGRRRTATMMGLLFSAVALAAHADDEPNKGQTQQGHIHRRKRRRRQLLETKKIIESAQNLISSPLQSAAAAVTQTQSSSSQSIRRTESQTTHSSAGKTPLQSQQPQARHFDNVCERAAQAYVAEGGNCSCVHDPISDEIVTLDCHFPACEECVTLGRTDVCATMSTHLTLSDVGSNNGGKPAEVSYTECVTYTKGRSGDTLCYTEFLNPQGGLFEDCFLDVNGVFCDSCRTDSCEGSQVAGLSQLDCSNVNGGSRWDFCESGGVFDPPVAANSVFLAFADPGVFYFDMCSRDPILAWTPFLEHNGNVDYTKTFDYPPAPTGKYPPYPTSPGYTNNVFASKNKGPRGNIFKGSSMGSNKMKKSMKNGFPGKSGFQGQGNWKKRRFYHHG